jgi:hypothetical protein
MFERLKNLLRPPEAKASRTARLISLESPGRARWTPRDYAALSREGYLCNAIVHRAVRLVAENAASCSFLAYEGAAERENHPLLDLIARPNPRQDGAAFFEALYSYLLLAGNAYVEAVSLDGQGGQAVRELYALRPDRMKVVPGADGWAEAYEYAVAGRTVRFDQAGSQLPPILHLATFHPLDDHYGLSALEAAAVAIEGGDGHLRYKMSKESASKTLSLLMQTNFSGRAEIGLIGDDDFRFKVSADGSSWLDSIVIDRTTGKVAFSQGLAVPAAPLDALAFNGMQINGNVDVSQELGTTGATLVTGTEKYIADLIAAKYVHGAATAVVTSAQIAAASFPAVRSGYSFGHQIKATTAITAPANGDYAYHRFYIEGYRVARLGWGAAGAQPLAFAFQFYSTAAGTAFARFTNAAANRAYHREFVVAAGWNWITGTLAGDTSGTWEKAASAGLIVDIFSSGKAAAPAAPDAWSATPATQTTNSTNLLGTNNNLTIVTGFLVLPGIEVPTSDRASLIMRPLNQELIICKRYWQKVQWTLWGYASGANERVNITVTFPVEMRQAPTVTRVSIASHSNVRAGDPTTFVLLGAESHLTARDAAGGIEAAAAGMTKATNVVDALNARL